MRLRMDHDGTHDADEAAHQPVHVGNNLLLLRRLPVCDLPCFGVASRVCSLHEALLPLGRLVAKKEWCDKLSLVNKAEILASVVHILTSHMPDVWKKVPKWYRKQLSFAMYDCSVDMKEFSEKDLRQIRAYFKDFNKKHPEPKRKKK
jgi:hypothetical protein